MKKLVPIVAFVALLPAANCKPEPDAPVVEVLPPFSPDGGTDAEVPDLDPVCRAACENLVRVGCPEGAPAGRSCASVCTMAVRAGAELNLACVASASTPDQVRACGSVDCKGR